jgi:acyl carrier protein
VTPNLFTEADVQDLLTAVGMEPAASSQAHSLSFDALDLDSLARMEIASRIRGRFGIEVEEELTADTTPEYMKDFVNQRLAAASANG